MRGRKRGMRKREGTGKKVKRGVKTKLMTQI